VVVDINVRITEHFIDSHYNKALQQQRRSKQSKRSLGHAKMARRKVRTPQGRVLHNVESRRREGKCNRKQTASHCLRGKGETVR